MDTWRLDPLAGPDLVAVWLCSIKVNGEETTWMPVYPTLTWT